MKLNHIAIFASFLLIFQAGAAYAQGNSGRNQNRGQQNRPEKSQQQSPGQNQGQSQNTLTDEERRIITEFMQSNRSSLPPGPGPAPGIASRFGTAISAKRHSAKGTYQQPHARGSAG